MPATTTPNNASKLASNLYGRISEALDGESLSKELFIEILNAHMDTATRVYQLYEEFSEDHYLKDDRDLLMEVMAYGSECESQRDAYASALINHEKKKPFFLNFVARREWKEKESELKNELRDLEGELYANRKNVSRLTDHLHEKQKNWPNTHMCKVLSRERAAANDQLWRIDEIRKQVLGSDNVEKVAAEAIQTLKDVPDYDGYDPNEEMKMKISM
ncbi:hypothetical protein [uncultured Roseibium sp.]|uniref:hypothetical protein n=1 Tax=uncultured Roseibium sp. TaxID=1936171 RepID=UPI0026399BA6|nr:hypothetical protein [uncultured Roseibium sp.]